MIAGVVGQCLTGNSIQLSFQAHYTQKLPSRPLHLGRDHLMFCPGGPGSGAEMHFHRHFRHISQRRRHETFIKITLSLDGWAVEKGFPEQTHRILSSGFPHSLKRLFVFWVGSLWSWILHYIFTLTFKQTC